MYNCITDKIIIALVDYCILYIGVQELGTYIFNYTADKSVVSILYTLLGSELVYKSARARL